MSVYVVSAWEWGGGGDDERRILSVHRTAEGAEAHRREYDGEANPGTYPADVDVYQLLD